MRRAPARSTKRKPPADWVHQFLIVLANTNPLVWRRIQVPDSYSFWDLHVAIQDAMGWLDYHLHEFRVVDSKTTKVKRFGIPVDESLEEPPIVPGWTVRLSTMLGRDDLPILYVYDFGDDWHHAVIYEGGAQHDRSVTYPRCIGGARKCPPEDCGGVYGYAEFLEAIRDPNHERHAELLEWVGGTYDPENFDPTMITFNDPMQRWKIAFKDAPE